MFIELLEYAYECQNKIADLGQQLVDTDGDMEDMDLLIELSNNLEIIHTMAEIQQNDILKIMHFAAHKANFDKSINILCLPTFVERDCCKEDGEYNPLPQPQPPVEEPTEPTDPPQEPEEPTEPQEPVPATYFYYGPYGETINNSNYLQLNVTTSKRFILNTGTVHKDFYIVIPTGNTLQSVIDLDADNRSMLPFYEEVASDIPGYKIYWMWISVPNLSNHRQDTTIA